MDTHELLSVTEELAEVTRLLADDDLPTTMHRFVTRATRVIPGCDAAVISAPWRNGIDTVAATDWRPCGRLAIELGPIGDVFTYGEPRRIDDVRTERRWPEFCAELATAGFGSALAMPLSAAGEDGAALTLVARRPHAFHDSAFDLAQLFTTHAGPVLDNAVLYDDARGLVDQLRTSLRTRSVIGQAQGLLMAADDSDAERSFETLRRTSQEHNVKLRTVAEELVSAHENGNYDEVARRYGLPPAGQ